MTPDRAFELLSKLINAADPAKKPEIQQRINAHVKAVAGFQLLAQFHNSDKPASEKVTVYQTCLRALSNGLDWSKLQGQDNIGKGDKRADPLAVVPVASPTPLPAPSPAVRIADIPPFAPQPRAVVPAAPVVALDRSRLSGVARLIFDEIEPFLPKQDAAVGTDEAKVGEMISDAITAIDLHGEMDKHLANGGFPSDRVKKLVDDAIAAGGGGSRITIEDGAGAVRVVEGLHHWQLPQVITWVNASVPLWLWGGAGAGKTHLPRQVGGALGMPYYTYSIDPTTSIGKLLGFRNLANGEFVEGWLFKSYKEGGVVLLDELDTGDPGVLAALNALLANDEYTFPNGERVKRHDKLRIMVGANTKGCGAVAGYTARNRLDAATLDRFAVVELTYDEGLELSLATGLPKPAGKTWTSGTKHDAAACAKWVKWVQKVRANVGTSVLVSPRASINGAKALRAGIPVSEVMDAMVFRFCTSDTRRNIISACGEVTL